VIIDSWLVTAPAGTVGFIGRHGLVRYKPTLGRKYPRDGLCEVCNRPPTRAKPILLFDHCHLHGWVRGLVCSMCNDGLGFLENGRELKNVYATLATRLAKFRLNCPDCRMEECAHAYPVARYVIGIRVCRICG